MQQDTWKKYNFEKLKGRLINSGNIVLNLKQMRKENLLEKFIELSKEIFSAPDQDILNYACRDRIRYLSHIYFYRSNYSRDSKIYRDMIDEGYIKHDGKEPAEPVIIHFVGPGKKPWLGGDKTIAAFDLWWYFAGMTPFYNPLKVMYDKGLIEKNKPKSSNSLQPLPHAPAEKKSPLGKIFLGLLCCFVPSKTLRHRIRK
jgi:lipopolysaccharide biosynthesis glycosyltransferase